MGDSHTRGGHPDAAKPNPASARPPDALHLAALAAVAGGGAIGTLLRAGLDAALPHAPTGLAASTLLVNVLGSVTLGVLVGWASPRVPGWARAGLGAGLLGAFTTYSAFAVSVVQLADGGRTAGAVATVLLTLVLGIGSAAVGHLIGLRLAATETSAAAERAAATERAAVTEHAAAHERPGAPDRAVVVAPWPEVDE